MEPINDSRGVEITLGYRQFKFHKTFLLIFLYGVLTFNAYLTLMSIAGSLKKVLEGTSEFYIENRVYDRI